MIPMTKRIDIHSKSHDQEQVDMYLEHLIAASAHHVQAHHLLLRSRAYELHHLIIWRVKVYLKDMIFSSKGAVGRSIEKDNHKIPSVASWW